VTPCRDEAGSTSKTGKRKGRPGNGDTVRLSTTDLLPVGIECSTPGSCAHGGMRQPGRPRGTRNGGKEGGSKGGS